MTKNNFTIYNPEMVSPGLKGKLNCNPSWKQYKEEYFIQKLLGHI